MTLQEAIKRFCKKEYHDENHIFRLFAPDSGGYDCTDEVEVIV